MRYELPYRGRMILLVYPALISQISGSHDENEFEVMIISKEFAIKSDLWWSAMTHLSNPDTLFDTPGVFLVKMKHAFEPVKRDNSVNTYSRISTVPRGSEQSEWASPWTERASEASIVKRSAGERVSGVSGVSGASERTNEATEWPVQSNLRSNENNSPFLLIYIIVNRLEIHLIFLFLVIRWCSWVIMSYHIKIYNLG